MINRIFRKLGWIRSNDFVGNRTPIRDLKAYSDFKKLDWDIYEFVKKYTMTSPERIKVLLDSIRYITNANIRGDVVECGVWKGGSSMAVALMLKALGTETRNLWLYDTFEGMSMPSDLDVDFKGDKAAESLEKSDKETSNIWAYSRLSEVKGNMESTLYPVSKILYRKGMVEDTLLLNDKPKEIALLRLDTDWYESTYAELKYLYPLVAKGGIIIIDDYGHWKGCKKAVEDYFKAEEICTYLHRIDYTGRIFIK